MNDSVLNDTNKKWSYFGVNLDLDVCMEDKFFVEWPDQYHLYNHSTDPFHECDRESSRTVYETVKLVAIKVN